MIDPPKKAPGAGELTGRKLATAYYAGLSLLANFFGAIFWTLEQARCQLADRIDNDRNER